MTTATRSKSKIGKSRRPEIEERLAEEFHVSYEYRTSVPTSEFDLDRCLANQARFEPLNKSQVALYAEAMQRGDVFPALIAYRPGRAAGAKLITIDGNHRLFAAVQTETENQTVDVYEIERGTRPATINRMTHAFNARHGLGLSEEERVAAAVYLIDNGATAPAAAAEANAPLRLVKVAMLKKKANERASDVGVDVREWEALPRTIRTRLLNISTDEGFKDAVHLAYIAALDADQVTELVALLNTSKSSRKQREVVRVETDRWSERIQDRAGGVLGSTTRAGKTPTIKGRLSMVIGNLLTLPEDYSSLASAYSPAERPEQVERLRACAKRMEMLADHLESVRV